MYRNYKVIDADSHVIEPNDLWERYLEPKYRDRAPTGTFLVGDPPRFHFTLDVEGVHFGSDVRGRRAAADAPDIPYIPDGEGRLLTYSQAYAEFVELGFGPKAYMRYLDWRGLDYIVLYPTLGLFAAAAPMDPGLGAAIKRAYNNWLAEFCAEGNGRLVGVGGIDLRDVRLAVKEAERCVNDLGLRALYIHPDPPLPGVPLNSPYYDDLWSAVSELGVPLGIHEAAGHALNPPGLSQLLNSGIGYAHVATSFGLGAMVAALAMCGGGVCERHPSLQLVFTESTAGWVSTWLWYLDELWEREMYSRPTPCKPSEYFARQCYISAEPEEEAVKYVIERQGNDNIIYNTDFPHPREAKYLNPADEFLAIEGVDEESKRKILWDNAARLYSLD